MTQPRMQWKPNALYDVRRSGPVVAAVDGLAARAAAAAGDGFEWSSMQGARRPQGRWRAIVYAKTYAARRKNANENTLVRVLGSVR